MIEGEVLGVDKLEAQLAAAPGAYKRALTAAMYQAVIKIQATTKDPYLSGQALNRRTNNLSGSIQINVKEEGEAVVGKVGTNVVYGRVHEFGGTFQIPAHTRAGHPVSAHPATYPKRAFLAPSYAENREKIVEIFKAAVNSTARELK